MYPAQENPRGSRAFMQCRKEDAMVSEQKNAHVDVGEKWRVCITPRIYAVNVEACE